MLKDLAGSEDRAPPAGPRRPPGCSGSSRPPSSKKLSCTPTRSTPSTWDQMRASTSSAGVRGGTNSSSATIRSGRAWRANAARSTLPLGVRGRASRATKIAGTMYSGSRLAAGSPRSSRSAAARRPRRRHHVGHQANVPGASSPAPPHHALPHRRMSRQHRLDLPQLDAECPASSPGGRSDPGTQIRRPAGNAPGRRCGRAARPATRRSGSGTKRSAVSAGRPR